MKPLPVAPHTAEDWDILVNHRGDAERAYFMGWRLGISREADRRDAELMLCHTLARTDPVAASARRLRLDPPRPLTEWDL